MTSFLRITKYAFQGMGRNLWLTIMTITVLTVSLLSVNVLLSLKIISKSVTSVLEERVDVSVYLKKESTPEQVKGIRSYLIGLPQVATVSTIPPEEAIKRFKERHRDNKQVLASLEEVGENPLGTTLVVRAKTIDGYPSVLASLDHPAYRDTIQEKNFEDYSVLIGRVAQIESKLNQFGIALLLLFAFLALIITANTVRVAIFTHKEEIGIMKLVGAGNTFIRGPFVIESVIMSLLAIVLCAASVGGFIYAGTPYLTRFLGVDPGLFGYFHSNLPILLGVEFGSLVVLTVISSLYAVGRYMRK